MSATPIFWVNLGRTRAANGLVNGYTDTTELTESPEFFRSDVKRQGFVFMQPTQDPAAPYPFTIVDPSTFASVKIAVSQIGLKPTGGSFTLTGIGTSGGTTQPLAYNAVASVVQAQVITLTNFSIATVTGEAGGPYFIDDNNTGDPGVDLSGDATALTPQGSSISIQKTQTANGTLTNQWVIKLVRAYVVYDEPADPLPGANPDVTIEQAGSGTANKVFHVTWNPLCLGGSVSLSFLASSVTSTIGPIPYNVDAVTFAQFFLQNSDITDVSDVSVTKNDSGDYTVAMVGGAVKLSDTPALSVAVDTLIAPMGISGLLAVDTVQADALLNGLDEIDVTFEIEVTPTIGEPATVIQTDAILRADEILNNPTTVTSNPQWATIADVRAISGQTFASVTARGSATPEHVGQLGVQLDTGNLYEGTALSAGSWSPVRLEYLYLGVGGSVDGYIRMLNASNGFYTEIICPDATANRTLTAPDKDGTLALLSDVQDRPWVIKTTTYTAIAGDAIQADTSGAAWTLTLPASASVGDFIEVQDAALTWGTNNLTIARNGLKINGGTSDYAASVTGGKLSIVYISSAVGWSIK